MEETGAKRAELQGGKSTFGYSGADVESVVNAMNQSMLELYHKGIEIEPYLAAVNILTELKLHIR